VSSEPDNQSTENAPDGGLQPNTVSGTLIVATVLCLVCSLLVSGTAVALRGRIAANKNLIRQRNVLIAAGLYDAQQHTDEDVPRLFEQVRAITVQLPTRDGSGPRGPEDPDVGDIIPMAEGVQTPEDAALVPIPPELDLGGIKTRPATAEVYVIEASDGTPEQFVFPVYGKGLWSTLYGYIALSAEVSEGMPVNGITFYDHAETPGLGGEVDNPKWKAQWPGTVVFNDQWEPIVEVTKPEQATGPHEVDGISGATVTSDGVQGLVNYWLGPDGFGPFLERYRNDELNLAAASGN